MKKTKNKKGFIASSVAHVLMENWLLAILLLAAIMASMSLQLLPAFLIRKIIDENFQNGMLAGVWILAVQYLLVMSGANLISICQGLITAVLGQKILNRIRFGMSKRLSALSIGHFVNTPVGDVMSRLTTDVDAINTLFSAGIIDVVTDLFKIGGLLVSLYIIAPRLVWLEIAIIPVIYLLSGYFRKRIYNFQKKVRSCVADIYTFIQEWLRGVGTVKAHSLEKNGREKFRALLSSHLAAIGSISFYDSWFPCVMQTLRATAIAITLWLAADNGTVLSLALSVGSLAAIADLVGRMFAPIEALAQEFQTIQEAMAGIARVREFANEPIEERVFLDEPFDDGKGLIIEGVSFAYGKADVLTDIDVRLKHGEKTVFIGRSGAGKTTLMNIVAGLYRPTEGTVRICGVDPYLLPPHKRRRLIGVVPQTPQIFDGTVLENVTLGDETISRRQAEDALAAVGLDEIASRLPRGYDTEIGEGAAGLSGGEAQLLALARAIAADPKVLLLDEPTSGVDSLTEKQVFAAIRKAGQGRTILSISHRLSGIVDADSVYLMANGRITESGAPDELAGRGGWYSMYQKVENAGWDFI